MTAEGLAEAYEVIAELLQRNRTKLVQGLAELSKSVNTERMMSLMVAYQHNYEIFRSIAEFVYEYKRRPKESVEYIIEAGFTFDEECREDLQVLRRILLDRRKENRKARRKKS